MSWPRRLIWLGLALTLIAVSGAGLAAVWARAWIDTPLAIPSDGVQFEVAPGSSVSAIAYQLHQRGLLDHPRAFAWLARWREQADRIQAGEYELRGGLTPESLLDQLVSGKVVLHAVTIVEGWTFAQMLAELHRHPAIAGRLIDLSPAQVMARLGRDGEAAEGRFFPETYHFARGTSDMNLLQQAYRAMAVQLERAWAARVPDLPLTSAYEALILASIVEKETALASERPRIAGVFTRRIRLGMRLQSDPTVIYGLGSGYDGDIRKRDLAADTPYNTYTRKGVPPTPIAMPGAASLRAVTNPEEGDALYFVATGDPDGSHYFSATLQEHNAAVQRYLRRIRTRGKP